VSTNVDLFMCVEIVWENGPWPEQCCQVGDRIQVVDHDIC